MTAGRGTLRAPIGVGSSVGRYPAQLVDAPGKLTPGLLLSQARSTVPGTVPSSCCAGPPLRSVAGVRHVPPRAEGRRGPTGDRVRLAGGPLGSGAARDHRNDSGTPQMPPGGP